MGTYTAFEWSEAARAIASALQKSEKAILKLKAGSPQHRLTERNIRAFQIALSLIAREQGGEAGSPFTAGEQAQAQAAFSAAIARVEKVLPKFVSGTPQHTLAVRRIRAFEIAGELLARELEKERQG